MAIIFWLEILSESNFYHTQKIICRVQMCCVRARSCCLPKFAVYIFVVCIIYISFNTYIVVNRNQNRTFTFAVLNLLTGKRCFRAPPIHIQFVELRDRQIFSECAFSACWKSKDIHLLFRVIVQQSASRHCYEILQTKFYCFKIKHQKHLFTILPNVRTLCLVKSKIIQTKKNN